MTTKRQQITDDITGAARAAGWLPNGTIQRGFAMERLGRNGIPQRRLYVYFLGDDAIEEAVLYSGYTDQPDIMPRPTPADVIARLT